MTHEYVSLYRKTLAKRQHQYDASISSGEFDPCIYPWDSLPALYFILAVAIAPRLPLWLAKVTRYCAFILIVLHSAYIMSHHRMLWLGGGYAIGLANTWGTIMSGAILILNDAGRDFQRLETRPINLGSGESHQDGFATKATSSDASPALDLMKCKVPRVHNPTEAKQIPVPDSDVPAAQPYKLVWQGYPYDSSWLHVIDWTVDLITSFRGVNWNHRIPILPSMDAVPLTPRAKKPVSTANNQSKRTSLPKQTLRSVQIRALQDFIVGYLLLDFLKTTMMTDPYFLGLESLESPTPWPWLAQLNDLIPIATRFVRLLMSMAGVIAALIYIFSLSPLFFTAILPCLVHITKITKSPLLEPWMYPPCWYPLSTSVLHSGLAGLWGKFWHQTFRYGISEPSRVLIQKFDLDRRGSAARIIQLLIAFSLSGSLHAGGSYTSYSIKPSHPLTGSLVFFLSQGLGIFVQSWIVRHLKRRLPGVKTIPRAVKRAMNLLCVVCYLYFTGPLLTNDFARCGIWLFEPIPFSFLRGSGFGPGGEGEGWWAWHQEGSRWIGWWSGNGWWERGMAIY